MTTPHLVLMVLPNLAIIMVHPIGMKEMAHGTAEAYLDVVIGMTEDIAGIGADREQNAAEIILKVKS